MDALYSATIQEFLAEFERSLSVSENDESEEIDLLPHEPKISYTSDIYFPDETFLPEPSFFPETAVPSETVPPQPSSFSIEVFETVLPQPSYYPIEVLCLPALSTTASPWYPEPQHRAHGHSDANDEAPKNQRWKHKVGASRRKPPTDDDEKPSHQHKASKQRANSGPQKSRHKTVRKVTTRIS